MASYYNGYRGATLPVYYNGYRGPHFLNNIMTRDGTPNLLIIMATDRPQWLPLIMDI
jgi:hypothetical protein